MSSKTKEIKRIICISYVSYATDNVHSVFYMVLGCYYSALKKNIMKYDLCTRIFFEKE